MSDRIAPESLLSHADFIRRLAWRLLRDEHQAEDVVQQTWIAAMERPPSEAAGGVRSWLGVVTRNLALKTRRAEDRRRKHEQSAARAVRVPSAEQVLEREAVRQRVVTAVLELDEPYRSAVLLRFFESLPPRAIAASLDVPVETVRTRLKRAFALLRERLDAEHGGERHAWALLLLPLTRGAPFIGIEGLPDTASPTAPAAGGRGARIMSTATGITLGKVVAATLVVAAAGGAAMMMFAPDDEGDGDAPATETAQQPAPEPVDDGARPARTRPASLTTPAAAQPGGEGEGDAVQPFVSGQLVDEAGRPFADAWVRLLFEEDEEHRERDEEREEREERGDETDENGRFRLEVEPGRRVGVAAGRSPEVEPLENGARWVESPADDVRLVARRMQVGTLAVRVNDPASGKAMTGFLCRVGFLAESDADEERRGESFQMWSEGEEVTRKLRIEPGRADLRLEVSLVEPALAVAPKQEIRLLPGRRTLVSFDLPERNEVSGQVLAADGTPVPEAFVFFGDEFRGRRNWARPVHPEYVPDGVHTDADGRFTVRGDAKVVTAYHIEHGVVTAAVGDAASLVLPATGAIRGRVLDLEGRPLADAKLHLDRMDRFSADTDADGRFTFGKVMGGARWVQLPKPMRHVVGVVVDAGQTADVDISGWLPEVQGELRSDGKLAEDVNFGGVVVGLDRVFSLHEIEVSKGRFKTRRILPGRYVFLSRKGHLAIVNIDGPSVTADAGRGHLTVSAAPGTKVYVIPGAAPPEHVRLFAPYNAREIPESGELSWGPLPSGTYSVGVARRGIKTRAQVSATGGRVTLE